MDRTLFQDTLHNAMDILLSSIARACNDPASPHPGICPVSNLEKPNSLCPRLTGGTVMLRPQGWFLFLFKFSVILPAASSLGSSPLSPECKPGMMVCQPLAKLPQFFKYLLAQIILWLCNVSYSKKGIVFKSNSLLNKFYSKEFEI